MQFKGKFIGEVTAGGSNPSIQPAWFGGGEAIPEAQVRELFPPNGRVLWPLAHRDDYGGLVLFEFTEGKHRRQGHDPYQVEVAEILPLAPDLQQAGDMAKVANELVLGHGLGIPRLGLSRRVRAYLGCSDGWVGPVDLIRGEGHNPPFYHLDSTQPGLDCLPWYARNPLRLVLKVLGLRQVVLPNKLLVPDGIVDWRSAKVVFTDFLGLMLKNGKPEDPVLTRTALEDLASTYFASDAYAAGPALDRFRGERVRALLRDGAQVDAMLQDVQEDLLQLPTLMGLRAKAMDAGRAEGRAEGLAMARAEAEAALVDLRTQGDQVREEIRTEEQRLEALREQVNAFEATETQLAQRLKVLLAKPGKVLADAAVLRLFMQPQTPLWSQVTEAQAEEMPWPVAEWCLESWDELTEALEAEGLPIRVVCALLATWAAGLVPILCGPHAAEMLVRLAKVAFGTRHHQASVSPTMLEPTDLLGRFEASQRAFLPGRSRTLDWLVCASDQLEGDDTTPGLLVLEGANRAPTESFLLPLLEAIRRGGSLPLFHPLAMAEGAWAYNPELVWPRNVLMAVCLAEGPTTLPVCSSLWAHSVLISTHAFSVEPPSTPQEPGETMLGWYTLEAPACTEVKERFQDRLPSRGGPLYPFRTACIRYGQALLELGLPMSDIWSYLVEGLLLPAHLTLGIPLEPRPDDQELVAAAESWQKRALL